MELKKDFPAQWQRERRIAYLDGRIEDLLVDAFKELRCHEDYVRRNRLVEIILTRERLDEIMKEVMELQRKIRFFQEEARGKRPGITDAMIERARAYPFSQLYTFTRNAGKCPFHDDKTPSFVLMRDNRAHCFGACGRSWDTIQFVRDRDGLSFPQAVKSLQ